MVMSLLTSVLIKELPRAKEVVPFWVRWRECRKWPLTRGLKYAVELLYFLLPTSYFLTSLIPTDYVLLPYFLLPTGTRWS